LHFNGALGRQFDQRAGYRAGVTPSSVIFTQRRERHHLKAAGIGQDRVRLTHERMQPAKRGDAPAEGAASDDSVAQQNLGARDAHVIACTPLIEAACDRHEGRRMHHAMRGDDRAGACGAVCGGKAEGNGSDMLLGCTK
jgi:hypothetical protein